MLFTKIITSKTLQKHCQIDVENIGQLTINNHQILAFDPTNNPSRLPFEKTVSNGNHDVFLYYHGSGKVALAEIRFESSLSSIVRWEMANQSTESLSSLTQDELYGYTSESGLGAFTDVSGKDLYYERKRLLQENESYYDHILSPLLEDNAGLWAEHQFSNQTEQNMLIFQTGWGEGEYASYWGLDCMGNPVCLVTDFSILDIEDYDVEMMQSIFNQSY